MSFEMELSTAEFHSQGFHVYYTVKWRASEDLCPVFKANLQKPGVRFG
jgi:hypothetical protein